MTPEMLNLNAEVDRVSAGIDRVLADRTVLLAAMNTIQGVASLHSTAMANHIWRIAEAARTKVEGA